jgi:hypothetical protein
MPEWVIGAWLSLGPRRTINYYSLRMAEEKLPVFLRYHFVDLVDQIQFIV